MATSATTDTDQMDRLSDLSDEVLLTILAFLPTHIAARTSVLSRRFRHLWEASPSLDLTVMGLPRPQTTNFIAMADRALLRRNPSLPLLSLRLNLTCWELGEEASAATLLSLLISKARALSLRHLTIGDLDSSRYAPILPDIFSISTLNSLSLGRLPHPPPSEQISFPTVFNLSCLRSLSLKLCPTYLVKLDPFLSQLCCLQDLHLMASPTAIKFSRFRINLSSKTIRKLKLIFWVCTPKFHTVRLFLPSLEFLDLFVLATLPHINGEVPLLRKAIIDLREIHARDVSRVAELLNCISHVKELNLRIEENGDVKCPIPILFKPEKVMLNFSNLKHLDVTACFHEHNFEAVTTMLHHSPALESLNLVHKVPGFTYRARGRKRKDWGSKLPRNADGNYRYAHFRNLHLVDNRKEFMKWISKKHTLKRKERI